MSVKTNIQNANLSHTEIASSQNYGNSNIQNVQKQMSEKRQMGSRTQQVYTLIQVNSPCAVTISKASRRICAGALMK